LSASRSRRIRSPRLVKVGMAYDSDISTTVSLR
jgi:hypothetical protein